jgi:hypothetical protein
MTKIQFIKNSRLPVCLTCDYFKQLKYGTCTKFGEKNVINGKVSYVMADISRANENMCGQSGVYFEKKYIPTIKLLPSSIQPGC